MFFDENVMPIDHDERDAHETVSGVVHAPNAVREGIVDVISMKALVRAVDALRRNNQNAERAIADLINMNGAMARAFELSFPRTTQDGERK